MSEFENTNLPFLVFGTVKVGERGQIVIPREARDKFDIKAGDTLIVLGDEKWDRSDQIGCVAKICVGILFIFI